MEYISLGSISKVSRVCFGCLAFSGHSYGPVEESDCIAAAHAALDAGINFFDVADVYGFGRAEELLGRALKGRGSDAVIATKFGVGWTPDGRTFRDISPERVQPALEASLRRLRVDSVALFQIHWPDGRSRIEDVMAELVRCKQAGKIREIGCSNFDIPLLRAAAQVHPMVAVQMPFSLAQRESEPVFRHAREAGMATLSYGSLGEGLFTGKYDSRSRFSGTDQRLRSKLFQSPALERNLRIVDLLRDLARKYRRTLAQIALRWLLDNELLSVAIAGGKSPRQAVENAGAADWRLDPADFQLLDELSMNSQPVLQIT